jgi:hypothetical protein
MVTFHTQRRSKRRPQWVTMHEARTPEGAAAFKAWCDETYGPVTEVGRRFGVAFRIVQQEV